MDLFRRNSLNTAEKPILKKVTGIPGSQNAHPAVFLYKGTAKKKISILIPAAGIVLILEGIHQGVGYPHFQRFNPVKMHQEISGPVRTF